MAINYYVILGIDPGASQQDVKKAYRRKAKEFHPDLYGDDSAPFKDVQTAYSVLSDPTRRKAYDASLLVGRPRRPTDVPLEPIRPRRPEAEPLIPRKAPVDLGDISLTRSFSTIRPSVEELFERLWSNFTGSPTSKGEGTESLTIEVPIPWEQAQVGGRARVLVPARVPCPTCGGQGGVGCFECHRCWGAGVLVGEFPVAVDFPGGIPDNYVVSLALDQLGIHNLYLVIRFRII